MSNYKNELRAWSIDRAISLAKTDEKSCIFETAEKIINYVYDREKDIHSSAVEFFSLVKEGGYENIYRLEIFMSELENLLAELKANKKRAEELNDKTI